ncbi:MAG: 50S ribosomal protein L29 [Candidatus Buchananbacteria bacterium RIFCSPHIGHO2_01_FULL_39_14]|uniref:Large ribosomal subunit protein uL29 n=2 Tax=Candidatus Buchananiibacteriota TaxID=1817903 RepID=A0A1G1YLU9_9BACT|nr:MAG: 50S ribosomal protein L29 [Candidatus Buchananbacteria bacterium RIFCSPHIGHO2_01_FULL_39_14]OGY49331.1 MAG: 50S ribosomal protein L29 [Candidatus Buchananbacteria bacterium RIFCSPHIGHO2_02_FULL_39_17]OGY53325.1 MAG: 50S ribosomal protein L29 [Candidatus Buchananbacteria bacterium RIFCSPLOWO2_01_FULL_40_23b]
MVFMEYKELKNKSEKELQKLLEDWRNHLRDLRFKASSDQLKNVREIRQTRKNIAQVLFLLGGKKLEKKS